MDSRQERKQRALGRRTWRVLAIALGIGLLALLGYDRWLDYLVKQSLDRPGSAIHAVQMANMGINAVLVVLAGLLARCLFSWSRQTREQGQWPPAGLDLPHAFNRQYGADALRTSNRLKWAGIAAVGLAIVVAFSSVWRWLN
jgi:hypothetical protein